MFGLYRFLLAILVALSHFGFQRAGFNPGQWAVVCFYVLSGLLMQRQYRKLAPEGGVRSFYIDRVLRIFPLYLVAVILYTLVFHISVRDWSLNALLFPVNYAAHHFQTLIPPAWSLASEAHFYVLVPLLVLASTRTLLWLTAGSLALFVGSCLLPDDAFWAYVALPGILFTFITGLLIDRKEWVVLRWIYIGMTLLLPLFIAAKVSPWHLKTGIHINICLGYAVAVPATSWLVRFSPRVKWDQVCGLFSFPLFLIHSLMRELGQRRFVHFNTLEYLALSIMAAGALILLVEKPFDAVRYWARGRGANSKLPP